MVKNHRYYSTVDLRGFCLSNLKVILLFPILVFLINVPVHLLILGVFVPIFFVFHLNKDFPYLCSKIDKPICLLDRKIYSKEIWPDSNILTNQIARKWRHSKRWTKTSIFIGQNIGIGPSPIPIPISFE